MTTTRYAEPLLAAEAFADLTFPRNRVRRRLVLLGAVVLLLAVAAVLGRGHAGSSEATSDAAATTPASPAPTVRSPASPAATTAATANANAAATSARSVSGVPVGYPQTRAGAE